MRVVTFKDLRPVKGIDLSRTDLARKEAAGEFPRRIWLAPNRFAWLDNELDEWLKARVAQRDKLVAKLPPPPLKRPRGRPRTPALAA